MSLQYHLSDDQRLIQESVRTFLSESSGSDRIRHVTESRVGWDEAVWAALAGNMGYAGLMVPQAYGGSGLGALDMALVLEETGRTLAVVPFFETAVLAVQLILATGTEAQKRALLPDIAIGRCKVAVAMMGAHGVPYPEGLSADLTRDASGWVLSGEAAMVTFAHAADMLLVFVRRQVSGSGNVIGLVALPPTTAGVTIERVTNLDLTRPFCKVKFDDVHLKLTALLGEDESATELAIGHALAIASGLLAAEQTGGAAFCLASTLDYAKQRIQFGRTIGSFQAVKHTLADMAVVLEAARSAVWYAALAIDHSHEELYQATSAARIWCSNAYQQCASEAIQLHGGIGFTWDHPTHFYFKRSRSSSTWLGAPTLHLELIARVIGLDEDAA